MKDSVHNVVIERSRQPNPGAGFRTKEQRVHETGLIWEMDLQGICTVDGSSLDHGFEYVAECPAGKGPIGFMPTEDAEKCLSLLANALAEAKPSLEFRHRILRKGGDELLMVSQGTPMHDDTGNLTGYRFVGRPTSQIGASDELDGPPTAGLPDGADIEARLRGLVYSLIAS